MAAEIERQLAELPKTNLARRSLAKNGAVLVREESGGRRRFRESIRAGAFEPCRQARKICCERIESAGSIFLGDWSAQTFGDYASGTNHVLPTGGVARTRGGLSVADFVKCISVQEVSRAGVKRLAPVVAEFARAEGLEAHARSVEVREVKARAIRSAARGRANACRTIRRSKGARISCAWISTRIRSAARRRCAARSRNSALRSISAYPGAGNRAAQGREAFRRAAGGTAADERHGRSAQPGREHVRRAAATPCCSSSRRTRCIAFIPSWRARASWRRATTPTMCFPWNDVLAALRQRAARFLSAQSEQPHGQSAVAARELQRILKAAPRTMVVIDEAYFEFSGVTVIPWIRRHANLIVTRTFSKTAGLAGLRLGCIFVNRELAATMRKAQSPYPGECRRAGRRPKRRCGIARLSRARCAKCSRSRAEFAARPGAARRAVLSERREISCWCISASAQSKLWRRSARKGILVRDRSSDFGGEGYVRITLGTLAQTRRLLRELKEIL